MLAWMFTDERWSAARRFLYAGALWALVAGAYDALVWAQRVWPGLLAECRTLGGCPTGEARLTRGYNLPARYVIHTVGPIWRGGKHGEDELLARCYRSVFAIAAGREDIRTLAFPSISTGAYGFPIERASRIALREMLAGLEANPRLEKVIACCYSAHDLRVYEEAYAELCANGSQTYS
jgi:O-acetyl-ADP-ribose deacetylase (regulator of RNase III)